MWRRRPHGAAVTSSRRLREASQKKPRGRKIVVYFDTRGDVYFCNEDADSPPDDPVVLNVIEADLSVDLFVSLYIRTERRGL